MFSKFATIFSFFVFIPLPGPRLSCVTCFGQQESMLCTQRLKSICILSLPVIVAFGNTVTWTCQKYYIKKWEKCGPLILFWPTANHVTSHSRLSQSSSQLHIHINSQEQSSNSHFKSWEINVQCSNLLNFSMVHYAERAYWYTPELRLQSEVQVYVQRFFDRCGCHTPSLLLALVGLLTDSSCYNFEIGKCVSVHWLFNISICIAILLISLHLKAHIHIFFLLICFWHSLLDKDFLKSNI